MTSALGEVRVDARADRRVTIRRTTRVGDRQGDPLEDLGVVPDFVHKMTKRDVLEANQDLAAAVGEILAARTAYVLDAEPVPEGAVTTLQVTTRNLERLDVYVVSSAVNSSTSISPASPQRAVMESTSSAKMPA